MNKIWILCLWMCAVSASAQKPASSKATIVGVESPLRKQLLNLSRPGIEKEVGQAIEFLDPKIRLVGNYAFIFSLIQQKGGKPLDLKKVKQPDAESAFDNNYQAIYLKKKGIWTIYKQYTGCTDVCWAEWIEDKTLPKGLLPSDDNK